MPFVVNEDVGDLTLISAKTIKKITQASWRRVADNTESRASYGKLTGLSDQPVEECESVMRTKGSVTSSQAVPARHVCW